VGRIATVTEEDSVAQIEKIRREIVGGALPKELATGAEGSVRAWRDKRSDLAENPIIDRIS
jgi:hypothetical protein